MRFVLYCERGKAALHVQKSARRRTKNDGASMLIIVVRDCFSVS
jgi:hypothetical protein